MRERELYDQMNRASCLILLVGKIAAWNTVYLAGLDCCFIGGTEHASVARVFAAYPPLGWRHINFLGCYEFDLDHVHSLGNLRPLRNLPG